MKKVFCSAVFLILILSAASAFAAGSQPKEEENTVEKVSGDMESTGKKMGESVGEAVGEIGDSIASAVKDTGDIIRD